MFKARTNKFLGGIAAGMLGLVVLATGSAEASTIIDFAATLAAGVPGVGDQGVSTLTVGGVAVDGLYFDDDAWLPAHLYVRNEEDDHGLGICNGLESECPGPEGGGDINELDNDGADELLRLTLPDGFRWVSVQLSSVDDNDGHEPERGVLSGSSSGDPALAMSGLWQFDDSAGNEPSFAIPMAAAMSPYLFFQPFDWTGGGHTNNDFLVYKVEIERVDMPEPASLTLLGLGLLATGLYRRRQS
jgi:hypothetical protein